MSASAIHSYNDARRLARRRLPWMVFDYIDGAAGKGVAEARNLAALNNIELQPRVLVNVQKRNLGVDVLGHAGKVPFGISPMGMCNLSASCGLNQLLLNCMKPFNITEAHYLSQILLGAVSS